MIEAGLGGRYDATNVIPSKVQVLTTVGLEHTRWLGPTIADIAREKLAVVRDHATLVTGPLVPEAAAVAARWRRRGTHVTSRSRSRGAVRWGPRRLPALELRRRRAAAEAFLGRLDARTALRAGGGRGRVPGRLEQIADAPAHAHRRRAQPRRRAAALAEALEGRAVVGVVGDPRRQGRRGDAARRCCRCSTGSSSRARATRARCRPATLESLAAPAGRAAGARSSRTRGRRSSARASWPGRTAPCSPPARST